MSNSIECFVTNPCVVPSMPEPLFEMDSNAFSVVNPPVAKGWEQNFESFRDYKHFPLFQNESGDICQDTTPLCGNQGGNNYSPKTPTHTVLHPQRHPSKSHYYSIPLHPAPNMVQDYGSDSTLGMDYNDPHKSNTDRLNTYESLATGSATHDGILDDWWSNENGNLMNKTNGHSNGIVASYSIPIFPDGLPRPQIEQLDNFEDSWNHWWVTESECTPAPFVPSTIKPRALNLNSSFTSTASITTRASRQASTFSPESTVVTSTPDYTPSTPPAKELSKEHTTQSRSRHMLPSSRPVRNNDIIADGFDEDGTATDRLVENRRPSVSTPISAIGNTRSHKIIKNDFDIKHSNVLLTPKNNLLDGKSSSAIGNAPLDNRFEQNNFLISSRQAGMSYKAIRSNGNFTAAESTLRVDFER
ncbi:hypothetical protein H4I96_06686 [Botrytis cinerea]